MEIGITDLKSNFVRAQILEAGTSHIVLRLLRNLHSFIVRKIFISLHNIGLDC